MLLQSRLRRSVVRCARAAAVRADRRIGHQLECATSWFWPDLPSWMREMICHRRPSCSTGVPLRQHPDDLRQPPGDALMTFFSNASNDRRWRSGTRSTGPARCSSLSSPPLSRGVGLPIWTASPALTRTSLTSTRTVNTIPATSVTPARGALDPPRRALVNVCRFRLQAGRSRSCCGPGPKRRPRRLVRAGRRRVTLLVMRI